ncbi:MAG: hypothetical protein ABSC88_03325 [Terracidiphilus sp.]
MLAADEVLRFHLREDLAADIGVDPSGLDAVGRMAGNTWVRIQLIRLK